MLFMRKMSTGLKAIIKGTIPFTIAIAAGIFWDRIPEPKILNSLETRTAGYTYLFSTAMPSYRPMSNGLREKATRALAGDEQ